MEQINYLQLNLFLHMQDEEKILQYSVTEEQKTGGITLKQGKLFDGIADLGVEMNLNTLETDKITKHRNDKKIDDIREAQNKFLYDCINYYLETEAAPVVKIRYCMQSKKNH